MEHTIKLDDLNSYIDDYPFHTFASSTAEPKRLDVAIGRKFFRVVRNKEIIYEGFNSQKAVEFYNGDYSRLASEIIAEM